MSGEERQALAQLLRAPLADFVRERADIVRRLRAAGDRDVAAAVQALRKPTLHLWALNQVGRVGDQDLTALRAAAARVRQAQEDVLRGDRAAARTLTDAATEQRRLIEALTRRLGMLLAAGGHAANAELLRALGEDLRNASLADDDTWSALVEGRTLVEPGPVSLPAVDARLAPPQRRTVAAADNEARQRRIAAAEAEVHRAEELEAVAREQAQDAKRRLDATARALAQAREALEQLREQR